MFDEYLHIGELTARDCLEFFVKALGRYSGIPIFGSLPPKTVRI